MAVIELQEGETLVIADANAMHMKKKLLAEMGSLYLTSKRLVFSKNPNPMASPLLRLLVKSTRGGITHDIPLNTVKGLSRDKFGLNNMMVVTHGDGQVVKFSTKMMEQFEAELQKHIRS